MQVQIKLVLLILSLSQPHSKASRKSQYIFFKQLSKSVRSVNSCCFGSTLDSITSQEDEGHYQMHTVFKGPFYIYYQAEITCSKNSQVSWFLSYSLLLYLFSISGLPCMWELRRAVVRKSWDTLLNMVLILTPKTIMGYVCEHTSKYIGTGELSFVSSVPRSQRLVLYPSFIYSAF